MTITTWDVQAVRRRFPSLQQDFAFLDAPGGTQVPDSVGEAVARALREAGGNLGAPYATGERIGAIHADAEAAAARLLGCAPHEVTFGLNMSTLNFALTRTAARDLREGDEVLVSRLDHDAGVAPWVALAEDKGLVVRWVDLHPDTTLDLADLERKLSDRTRVVAFAWAANSVGTVTDARRVCELAHEAGALAWVDAVHLAAHAPIDVEAVGADVLLCSAYKFCGPHLGLAYGRAAVTERWRPYKPRPAPTQPLGRRFATGTPPFELLAGFSATVDYLDAIGGLVAAGAYERELGARFLRDLPDGVTVYGRPDMDQRVPTFLLNVEGMAAPDLARRLVARGLGVWAHDTYYALGLHEVMPYDQAVRVGFFHYTTPEEVDRLLAGLEEAVGAA
jgi:cysteine desulfurase family protein (TIGR01976 family)